MLSILIPVYTYDVRPLVSALYKQCLITDIPFEIRCYDDGSPAKWQQLNKELASFERVVYTDLRQNVGRAKIRNLLARHAKHRLLLFIDNDCKVIRETFIEDYLDNAFADRLVCGGHIYEAKPPSDVEKLLHWKYGREREVKEAKIRRQRPWHAFQSANFLIPKNIILAHSFDESLGKYGHEDTLFAMQLKQAGVRIDHIDNPVVHMGLEDAATFLEKHRQAVDNLLQLHRQGVRLDTKLVDAFLMAKNVGLHMMARSVYRFGEEWLLKHLLSAKPNLRFFDLYRLGYMLQQAETK